MGQWHYMLLLAVERVLQFMISLVIASFVFKTKSSSFCAVAGISMNWIFHLTLTKKVMMTIMTKKIPGQRSRSWSWWWSVNIFHLPRIVAKFENAVLPLVHSSRWYIKRVKRNSVFINILPPEGTKRLANFTINFKQYCYSISSSPSQFKLQSEVM